MRIALALAIVLGAASTAYAQPDAHEPAGPPPRRAVPDYDGLPEPDRAGENAALLVPRLILLPLHVVLEYGIRRPIGWLATTFEEEGLIDTIRSALTWDEGRAQLIPTVYWDLGFRPSVGARLSWRDLFGEGHELGAGFATWGVDWLHGHLRTSIRTSAATRLELRGEGNRRQDGIFAGIGYGSLQENVSRFARSDLLGVVALVLEPDHVRIRASAGVSWVEVTDTDFRTDNQPSLAQAIEGGLYPPPPGFPGSFTAYRQRIETTFDTRPTALDPAPDGVRLHLFGEQAIDVARGASWARYGSALDAMADLGGYRALGVRASVAFADPLGDQPIPFVELVELGGDPIPFGAYLRGRLRGRSSIASSIEYRYSILPWVDAQLFVSVGNVFDAHLADFDVERLRVSFGMGLRALGRLEGTLLLLAFGSETFAQGAELSSIRLVLGVDAAP